jgi:hypothetical protein
MRRRRVGTPHSLRDRRHGTTRNAYQTGRKHPRFAPIVSRSVCSMSTQNFLAKRGNALVMSVRSKRKQQKRTNGRRLARVDERQLDQRPLLLGHIWASWFSGCIIPTHSLKGLFGGISNVEVLDGPLAQSVAGAGAFQFLRGTSAWQLQDRAWRLSES